jgi:hypothetical protein
LAVGDADLDFALYRPLAFGARGSTFNGHADVNILLGQMGVRPDFASAVKTQAAAS